MSRFVLAMALAAPLTAAAADAPQAELSGGYSYTRLSDTGLHTSLHGWQAGLDYGLGRSFGLELAVSGQYGSLDVGMDVSRLTVLAGPRYAWRGERLTPFVHVLGGVMRTSFGIEVFDVDIRETDSDFGGVFGAGLDIGVGRNWALRLQGEYGGRTGTESRSPQDPGTGDVRHTEWEPRAFLGFVYRVGHR